MFEVFLILISQTLGINKIVIKSKNCKIKILENFEASYVMIPLTAEINVALRKQICQKIGSERVKLPYIRQSGNKIT